MRSVTWHAVDQLKAMHELEVCYETLEAAEPLFYYEAGLSRGADRTTGETNSETDGSASDNGNTDNNG